MHENTLFQFFLFEQQLNDSGNKVWQESMATHRRRVYKSVRSRHSLAHRGENYKRVHNIVVRMKIKWNSKHTRAPKTFVTTKLFLIHNYNKSLSQFERSQRSGARTFREAMRGCASECAQMCISKRVSSWSLPFYAWHLFSFTCSDSFPLSFLLFTSLTICFVS